MQLGFNTNFRYRGVLFHVQTEDSGTGNPHVITHLFHGGNIMASVKEDYSNLLEGPDGLLEGPEVEGAVRKMMESMHKTMLHRLSRGEHDEVIRERLGPDIFMAETVGAAEPPTVTEEELPPAPVGVTVLQPSDISPLPSASASAQARPAASASPPPTASAPPSPPRSATPSPAASPSHASAPTPAPAASPTSPAASASDTSNTSDASDAPSPPAGGTESGSRLSKVFGDRVVSEKPLDEVVLDYLVANARKRKRQPK